MLMKPLGWSIFSYIPVTFERFGDAQIFRAERFESNRYYNRDSTRLLPEATFKVRIVNKEDVGAAYQNHGLVKCYDMAALV